MDAVLALLFSLLTSVLLTALFLIALFLVVRAAVEQGVRRALPDSSLRPSVRDRLRRDEGEP